MSPTSSSSIYDHLIIHGPSRSKMTIRPQPQFMHSSNIEILPKRKSHSIDELEKSKQRRFTITNLSQPETVIHYTVSNQAYDRPLLRKSSTTHTMPRLQPRDLTCYRIPTSSRAPTIEIQPIDFRPLITQGRRRLRPIPTSASMIIVKKKSTTNPIPEQVTASSFYSFSWLEVIDRFFRNH